MPRLLPFFGIIVIAVWSVGVAAQPASDFATFAKLVPKGSLGPYVIPEALQRQAVAHRLPLQSEAASSYFLVLLKEIFSDQSFYIDFLTGVDVTARAWAQRHGAPPSEAAYRWTICFFSFPLPGCQSKSQSNRQKMTRVRQQLLVGAYASSQRRDDLRSRLTEKFLEAANLGEINLQLVDIEEYIRINDLLR